MPKSLKKYDITTGKLNDLNMLYAYKNICNTTCRYNHKFNNEDDAFDIDFEIVNNIYIKGTPKHKQHKTHVTLNNKKFIFTNIIFLLSRSINKYNGEEQPGEIILFLNDVDDTNDELFITIPITLDQNDNSNDSINSIINLSNKTKITNNEILKPIVNQSPYNTPSIQTNTLASLYDKLNNKTKKITEYKFKIGNFIPGNSPYYFRKEQYNIDDSINNIYYISYDVKHSVQINKSTYDIGKQLTPRLTDKNGNTSIPDVEKYILNLKRRFIVNSKLFHNPKINTNEVVHMECNGISLHDYDGVPVVRDKKEMIKQLFLYIIIAIICLIIIIKSFYYFLK
jgi:hypothetical protein